MNIIQKAHAQDVEAARTFINKVEVAIIDPIILLLFAGALAYFFWGIIVFINNTDNPTGKEQGKRHMMWGIVGMTIMVCAFGILRFIDAIIGDGSIIPN